MITTTLLEAYKATCYEIIQPKIAIFIGQENETLQIFLKENEFINWCFITAWNPYSNALSLEENSALNESLRLDLKDYKILEAQGKDTIGNWPPEPSFFVANISEDQAIALGKKYQQNAIVYGTINETARLITLVPIAS